MATTCEGGLLFAAFRRLGFDCFESPRRAPGHPSKSLDQEQRWPEAYCLNGNWSSLLAGLVFDDVAGDGAGRDGVRAG
jgi:hypothetical protein